MSSPKPNDLSPLKRHCRQPRPPSKRKSKGKKPGERGGYIPSRLPSFPTLSNASNLVVEPGHWSASSAPAHVELRDSEVSELFLESEKCAWVRCSLGFMHFLFFFLFGVGFCKDGCLGMAWQLGRGDGGGDGVREMDGRGLEEKEIYYGIESRWTPQMLLSVL